jgi:hypothetical protein
MIQTQDKFVDVPFVKESKRWQYIWQFLLHL